MLGLFPSNDDDLGVNTNIQSSDVGSLVDIHAMFDKGLLNWEINAITSVVSVVVDIGELDPFFDMLVVVDIDFLDFVGWEINCLVTVHGYFQLPTIFKAKLNPNSMSVSRDKPRHITIFPGGGSQARAR